MNTSADLAPNDYYTNLEMFYITDPNAIVSVRLTSASGKIDWLQGATGNLMPLSRSLAIALPNITKLASSVISGTSAAGNVNGIVVNQNSIIIPNTTLNEVNPAQPVLCAATNQMNVKLVGVTIQTENQRGFQVIRTINFRLGCRNIFMPINPPVPSGFSIWLIVLIIFIVLLFLILLFFLLYYVWTPRPIEYAIPAY
jgi:hypothetical protein